jgi:indolepyruvate ferredoxin oxidoreductase beta subunit
MAAIADESASVISCVPFGALGSGALPFARPAFEETIARGGVGVAASRRAFDAGFASALGREQAPASARAASVSDGSELAAPSAATASPQPSVSTPANASPPRDPDVAALVARVRTSFPVDAQAIVVEGVRRTIDWQDVAHARLYLDRLERVRAAAPGAPPRLLAETARHLALWMTYEDTIRVAALKTRATRFERPRRSPGRCRPSSRSTSLHPRLQEICETLPAGSLAGSSDRVGRAGGSSAGPRRARS